MVECDLAKVEVAGSTPVSRSMIFLAVAPRTGEGLCSQGQHKRAFNSGRGTQVVRERSAKPLCVGSIPTRASKLSWQLAEIMALSRHFYIRQLRDMKIKMLVELFDPSTMMDYAGACGWTPGQRSCALRRSSDDRRVSGKKRRL